MTGGFLGSCIGPWLSATLVGGYGLKGLFWLIPLIVFLLIALRISHVRLAIGPSSKQGCEKLGRPLRTVELPQSLVIAFFMNTGTVTIQMLLPTVLNELNFPLSFGGFSAMMFGIGSASGSIAIGFLVKKYKPQWFIFTGLLLGVPAVAIYFLTLKNVAACLLILLSGLLASSGYPLLVALSRNAPRSRTQLQDGSDCRRHLGLCRSIFSRNRSIRLPRFGVGYAMHASWIFYLLALITAVMTLRRHKEEKRADMDQEAGGNGKGRPVLCKQ